MKEELCEKVVEVRRVSDRAMAVVLAFEEDVLKILCRYALQSGRSFDENSLYMMNLNVSGICIVQMI